MERIFVACDVANLWKSCREEFGERARIDFQVLASYVPAKRHPQDVRQRLMAYLVTSPSQSRKALYHSLRTYGFKVRERKMLFSKAEGRPYRTDWDVGITVEALTSMDDFDTFVLMSGDGDFVPLLRALRSRKKKTMVLTFSSSASQHLYRGTDEIHLLGEDVVYEGEG